MARLNLRECVDTTGQERQVRRMEDNMYQNKNTGEIWELDHIETVSNNPKPIIVYVFKNGERWAEDLFFTHWYKKANN